MTNSPGAPQTRKWTSRIVTGALSGGLLLLVPKCIACVLAYLALILGITRKTQEFCTSGVSGSLFSNPFSDYGSVSIPTFLGLLTVLLCAAYGVFSGRLHGTCGRR